MAFPQARGDSGSSAFTRALLLTFRWLLCELLTTRTIQCSQNSNFAITTLVSRDKSDRFCQEDGTFILGASMKHSIEDELDFTTFEPYNA